MRYHPLYETARCAAAAGRRPVVLGAAAQLAGYAWAALRRTPSQLSPELVAFNQREQMAKLRQQVGLG